MPLTKRSISPVDVSLHRLPPNVRENELECVTNGTLANLVRQLSSLSKHAEDIFGELYREAMKVEHKTSSFFSRIDRVASKVTQLDSTIEEVSLQDLHLRKPFKSSSLIDQQSLSRQTMPAAMTDCYTCCDRPPELDKLNSYRTDGKRALKFYTDPDYFFELWRQEMLKDADIVKKTKNANKSKSGHGSDKKHKSKDKQKSMNREHVRPQTLRNSSDGALNFHSKNAPSTLNCVQAGPDQSPIDQIYNQNPQGGRLARDYKGYELTNGGFNFESGGGAAAAFAESANHINAATAASFESSLVSSSDDATLANQSTNQPNSLNYRPINIVRRSNNQSYGTGYTKSSSITPTGAPDIVERGGFISLASPDDNRSLSESTDQSKSSGTSINRPVRPPPAPPVNAPTTDPSGGLLNGPMADLRLVDQYALVNNKQHSANHAHSMSPPPPPPPVLSSSGQSPLSPAAFSPIESRDAAASLAARNGGGATYKNDRSASPDLPPPPPPLYTDGGVAAVDSDAFSPYNRSESFAKSSLAPPPPPPPPPPPSHLSRAGESSADWSNKKTATTNPIEGAGRGRKIIIDDGRSDLLRAIREGIQLKRVDRLEQKQRERAALEHHDVAAILKKRMEDIMGRQSEESDDENDNADDGSASGFEDDWDD